MAYYHLSSNSVTTCFSFDAAGNLATRSYPNGITTSFAYDADNRLTSQQAVKDAQTIQSFSQTYDAAGNITELTENGALTTSYSYDALNRLFIEDISGYGEIIYSYDRTGNRLSLEHPAIGQTTYSYNQANQLIQQVNWPDPTNFTYNANGALTQKTKGTDITTYSYNGLDKLTSVETPSATIDYAYDALGRRIRKSDGTNTKNFHLSGKSDLDDYRTNQNGDLTASMQRGPDGMFLFTNYSGGISYGYQLPNPHGDNTLITDETGAQVYSDHYDSFGNSIIGGDLGYGYTGKWQRETDYATGTVRMGVREYDPVVGRFTSADPLKGDAMDPQMRNRYPYVGNDPMSRYDLNGLYWGESYVNGAEDLVEDLYMMWQADPLFGPNPPDPPLWGAGREYMPESFKIFDDPRISTSILIGIGVPGRGGWVKCSDNLVNLKFSDYALSRMSSRGISELQVENVVRSSQPFKYYHEGVWKTGYYDEASQIFVAQSPEGKIINAFPTNSNYIRNLKNNKP